MAHWEALLHTCELGAVHEAPLRYGMGLDRDHLHSVDSHAVKVTRVVVVVSEVDMATGSWTDMALLRTAGLPCLDELVEKIAEM